jgi:hypothetical protein
MITDSDLTAIGLFFNIVQNTASCFFQIIDHFGYLIFGLTSGPDDFPTGYCTAMGGDQETESQSGQGTENQADKEYKRFVT